MKRGKNGVWYLNDSEMNYLSYMVGIAADYYNNIDYVESEREAIRMQLKIYRILKDAGFYD